MSFGASPSDIIIVVTFCKALYRKCRDAGGEYDEISREVKALHTVLRHLKYEVEAPESPLNRDRSLWGRQLAPIIGNCDYTLRELDTLLQKYGRLASSNSSSPSSPRVLWDRVRFGSNEMDTLGAIRVKLISHKSSLTLFLDTIQLHQSGKMQQKLDNHGGQLDIILDKVDNIAARMGQGNRSVMTSYEDDDKEVWKQFRRELVAEGFSSEVLMQHKDVLRAYIREIDQKGLLDETPHTTIAAGGVNTERWLEAVRSTESVDKLPPRFSTLGLASDDQGAKEMMVREENMKFPTSMKIERQKPDSHSPVEARGQLDIPSDDRRPSSNTSRPRQPSPVPRLITTPAQSFSEEKELVPYHHSTTDSDSDPSSKQLSQPLGMIIRTSDLLAATRALSLTPGSPLSYRSQSSMYGSSYDHDGHRSMASRSKTPAAMEYGCSPISPGAIPIPIPGPNISNPRSSGANLGTSPGVAAFKLAPDSHGNEIPPDAKWTKINRRLVSPEVLHLDGRRYEARPEFVAVLGELSREEIEDLAARSQELRESRRGTRTRSWAPAPEQQPPQQPPRPIAVPIPMPMPSSSGPRVRFGRDTPSCSSSSASESSSDSESDDRRRRRPKARGARSTISSNAGPVSGYPNPFGSPPSPPSTARGEDREDSTRSKEYRRREDRDRHSSSKKEKDDDAQRRRRHQHQHHHSSSSAGHHHSSSRYERTSSINPGSNASTRGKGSGGSRWKENLTAAGIGGAAVSLLNVLTEAAEGL